MSEDRKDYEVGFGRPPKHTRFKKGRSGNPKGKPKGAKNLKTDLLEELAESMKIRESGKPRRVSKQRALIKSLVARGLNGNDRAAAKILDLYLRVAGLDDDAGNAGLPLSEDERAVMQALEDRLLRRAGLVKSQVGGKGADDQSEGPDLTGNGGKTS
jgi:hypothetical protein